MKNYIQVGDAVTVVAPVGGLASGAGHLAGYLFGIAATDAAEGEDVAINTVGVYDLDKPTGIAFDVGARVYWDVANGGVTATATSNRRIGVALAAADNAAALVRVRLDGAAI